MQLLKVTFEGSGLHSWHTVRCIARTMVAFVFLMLGIQVYSGQHVMFEHRVPASVTLKPVHYGKNQTLKTLGQDSLLVCLNGVLVDGEREKNETNRIPKGLSLSSDVSMLWFLDRDGNVLAEKMLPGFCFVDTVAKESQPELYLITQCYAEGNDYVSYKVMVFSRSGKDLGTYSELNGRSVLPSFEEDGIVLCYRDADGYGNEFELVPLSSLLEPTSQEKETKGQRPRSVTVRFKDHSPSAFLYLGGPEMDYVVAFGGTIWRESAATQQIKWKVDDIGAPIQQIRTTDGVTLDIETEKPGIVVLDAETGTTVAALDAAHPVVKGGTLALFGTHYEKGWFVNVDFKHGRKVMLNSDTGETRTQLVAQPAVRSDQTGMTVRTIGGTTYRLEVKDGIVRLQMLPSSGSATN